MKEIKMVPCENLSVEEQKNYYLCGFNSSNDRLIVHINYCFNQKDLFSNTIAWVDIWCGNKKVYNEALVKIKIIEDEILKEIVKYSKSKNMLAVGNVVKTILCCVEDNLYKPFTRPIITEI